MIAIFVLTACLAAATPLLSADPGEQRQVAGTVRDASGAALPHATIVVRTSSGGEMRASSAADGRFSVPGAGTGDLVLIVRAEGFAERRQTVDAGAGRESLDIVLTPATVSETVTVTAARAEQRAADVAASVNVLGRESIQRSPALVADDVLRQVPTFSLFRRTSSLASHPTAQGVSLRGVGPSGVSRTLVMFDGVPFNDPFGGWVYWTRVPLGSIERIEVVDGASSSVYGNYAMGGVINIVTSPPARRTLEVRSQYGSRETPKVDLSASHVWGRLRASVDGALFSTAGYPTVAPPERGLVDTRASVHFQNATVKLQYDLGRNAHLFVRGWHFEEQRNNGKVSTIDGTPEENSTRWTSASGGLRAHLPDNSDLQITVFADAARFRSNFLAVPAATPVRSIGRMTLDQAVPSNGAGGMLQWARTLGARQFLTAGADWRVVDGDSEENGLDPQTGTRVTLRRISGGTQRSAGLFVQDLITPTPRLVLTVAARIDHWRNYNAHNLETTVPSNVPTANNQPALPEKTDTVASPRVSALYHVTDTISAWGAIGTGFRAPTLNELYRQFRVGTVLTLANNQLGPERLLGGELGIRIQPARNLTWRTTWFQNRVEDPVSNVTLTAVGANVTQQRQNLGRTRIRGVQTDVEYRVRTFFTIAGGYVYNDATVREFDANPSLIGRFLPQVPRNRGTVSATYTNPRLFNASLGIQAVGRQFDDDQNARVVPGYTTAGLPKYTLIDLSVSRPLARQVEIFGGVQNLLDREYFVGTLPTTIGTPRLIHAGIRVRLAPR